MVRHGLAGELNPKTDQIQGCRRWGWPGTFSGVSSPCCLVWECPVPGQGTEEGGKNFLCLLAAERNF